MLGIHRRVLRYAGWREYSDIPISYEDIEEVRPAPALPPDVQAQWERAQWILYLLRRCVRRVIPLCLPHMPCKWLTALAGVQRWMPVAVVDMRKMAVCCRQAALVPTSSTSQHESNSACFVQSVCTDSSLDCSAGRTCMRRLTSPTGCWRLPGCWPTTRSSATLL